jgi:uncharacterized protein involved in type VI secretion and phage assembly
MSDVVKSAEINLGFFSGAFEDSGALQLVGVNGRERLSQLFEFDLLLIRQGPPLTETELEDIVRQPCVVALGKREGDLVHGIISRIEHLDSARTVHATYVARMVPQVALLDLGRRSAIYQDTTVPKMVETILTSAGLSAGTSSPAETRCSSRAFTSSKEASPIERFSASRSSSRSPATA